MKRHPTLAHLSRDHHPALILSQLLKRNAAEYKGLPVDTEGKIEYAITFYNKELIAHFEQEEKMMQLLAGINPQLDGLVSDIMAEHVLLRQLFNGLGNHEDPVNALDVLGNTLDKHIRKEERELFPMIENNCDEKIMASIEKIVAP